MAWLGDCDRQALRDDVDRQLSDAAGTHARRRRGSWTLEEKLKIIREAEASKLGIQIFARRRGVNATNIYYWMRQVREGKLVDNRNIRRLARTILNAQEAPLASLGQGAIEVIFSNGTRIRINPPVEDEILCRILVAAKGAK